MDVAERLDERCGSVVTHARYRDPGPDEREQYPGQRHRASGQLRLAPRREPGREVERNHPRLQLRIVQRDRLGVGNSKPRLRNGGVARSLRRDGPRMGSGSLRRCRHVRYLPDEPVRDHPNRRKRLESSRRHARPQADEQRLGSVGSRSAGRGLVPLHDGQSAAPAITNVGTSICLRSSRKSVDENAVTQSTLPLGEAPAAMFQFIWTAWSLTSLPPRTSTLKKSRRKADRNAGRSAAIPALIPSNAPASTPCGLSAVCRRNGVRASMNTAFWAPSDPYFT